MRRYHRGKGILSEAIHQTVVLGFETFPDVTRIYATPFGSNIASQKALERRASPLSHIESTLVKNSVVHDELIDAVRR